MKKTLLLLMLAAIALLSGCTAADLGRMTDGADKRITLYVPDAPSRTWLTSGRVKSEDNSDGWYFIDKATGKTVIVSGHIVIEDAH